MTKEEFIKKWQPYNCRQEEFRNDVEALINLDDGQPWIRTAELKYKDLSVVKHVLLQKWIKSGTACFEWRIVPNE